MIKKDSINKIVDILQDFSYNEKYGNITIFFNAGKIQRISKLEDYIPDEKVIYNETFLNIKRII
jgi:hypothetical protein